MSSHVLRLHKILSPCQGKGNEISGTGDVLEEKKLGSQVERGRAIVGRAIGGLCH